MWNSKSRVEFNEQPGEISFVLRSLAKVIIASGSSDCGVVMNGFWFCPVGHCEGRTGYVRAVLFSSQFFEPPWRLLNRGCGVVMVCFVSCLALIGTQTPTHSLPQRYSDS